MPASPDTPTASPDTRTASRPFAGALAGLALSVLLASLGTSGANVALPTLATEFGASFQAVQWIVLAYLLAVTTLIVGVGRLGDIIGRRRLLLGGLALFTTASLASGLAPALPVLVGARAAQGLGAATMMALAMAFVGDAVPPARIGRAMGLLGTMSAVGTALGPSLGGLLLAGPGWRALFLVNVPLGLVALLLVLRHMPEGSPAPASFRGFDIGGTLLLASSLGAFALAATHGRGRPGAWNAGLLAGAAVSAALFVWRQASAPAPLLPASLLRDRGLAASLVTNALVACVMMSTLIVGPFYLTGTLALSPGVMGLVMTVGPVLTALAGIPAGRLVDQRGAYHASVAGLTAMLVGSVLLAVLPTALGVAGYLGPIVFLTVGYALFQAANNTAVMAHARSSERGVVGGVLSLSRNLGLITGASLMGAVYAATSTASTASGSAEAGPTAAAAGMRITFALAAALIVVAGVLAAGRRVPGRTLAAVLVVALLVSPATLRPQAATPAPRALPQVDPYPSSASGWGPQLGGGLFVSRWAEDWTARRKAGHAPPLKAMPLPRDASLTLSGELRARHDEYRKQPRRPRCRVGALRPRRHHAALLTGPVPPGTGTRAGRGGRRIA